MEQLFKGLKYVEFAWTGVGPMPGTYLASMGATVIRIESGTRPDPLRTMGPYIDGKAGVNRSLFYNAANSNKYGFSLNMNHPKAAGIARKLILWSDVLAESYTPGTMKNWGLEYNRVKEINPKIIYYSTSMSGQTGPYAKLPGFGAQLTGMSGFTMITGWPDRKPSIPYGAYTDFINIKLAIFVLVAALDYKRRTGQGQFIDLSQFEGGVFFLAPLMLDYAVNRRVAVRNGNRDPAYAPHGVYRCKGDDQWCALAVGSSEEWQAFSRVIGNPRWSEDPKFATHRDRKVNEEELDAQVAQWTVERTPQEVMDQMQAAGIPAGVVKRPSDTFKDPQLAVRQVYRTVHHSEIGEHFAFNMTAGTHFSTIRPQVDRSSPCIGEHNHLVCRDILNLSEDEFRMLTEEGVFD